MRLWWLEPGVWRQMLLSTTRYPVTVCTYINWDAILCSRNECDRLKNEGKVTSRKELARRSILGRGHYVEVLVRGEVGVKSRGKDR
jgi:hypothetical protein